MQRQLRDRGRLPRAFKRVEVFLDYFDIKGMLMEWTDLCLCRQTGSGIFAHDPAEGEKYMENRRLQILPTFETLMLLGLPKG
eukprot:5768405-Karenia_brevis.AAC.1